MMHFVKIILIVLSVSTIAYCMVRYDNYQVFRIIPTTDYEIQYLRMLERRPGYSFWIKPRMVLRNVDVQVAPTNLYEFYHFMNNAEMNFDLLIENMQDLIDRQIMTIQYRDRDDNFDFDRYHTLEEIYAWMDGLATTRSSTVQKIVGGYTYEGRQIEGIRLRFGRPKPGIFIEGGIHSREWIAPATVIYLIDKLLNSRRSRVRQLAERYDWYIFPICNPDGYVHTHDVDRMWRKSLSDTGMGPNPENPHCKGVDLNRNFGYKWQEEPEPATDPCKDDYSGPAAFSEIETQSLCDYIQTIQAKLFTYLSFHSYGQFLMIPYGYTAEHLDNYDDAYAIGYKAIRALHRKHGSQYLLGNPAEVIYAASGVALDWAKGTMKLDLCFAYELRDIKKFGFLLPPEQIIPTGEETLESLIAMFEEANNLGYPKGKKSRPSSDSGPGESSGVKKKSKLKIYL